MDIFKLHLQEKYCPEITGLGEIYEQISVEVKRKNLLHKFKNGSLFLAPNSSHGGKGLTLKELEKEVLKGGGQILEKGFVDSPPWPSKPRQGTRSPLLNTIFIFLSKPIFRVLIGFEFLWEGQKKSHMVYAAVRLYHHSEPPFCHSDPPFCHSEPFGCHSE